MMSKTEKRTGWLRAWFSKHTSGRHRGPGGNSVKLGEAVRRRKLRCELLERRELLSATVVAGTDAYKTIPVTSTNGIATMTASSTNYTASTILAANIAYTSPTQGTVTGSLNGTVTSTSDNGQTFTASINSISQTGGNLSGSNNSVVVTAPSNLAGSATSLTGTFDTSQFTTNNTSINWTSANATGTWNGIVNSTITAPFSISLTTPQWDSAAQTQIDFGFTATGNWDPVAASAYGTPVSNVNAYWATGATASTETGLIGDVPVSWNQASGAASVQGISPSSIPAGANYVLFQVGSGTNLAAFKLPPSFALSGPTSGTFSAGQTVAIQWAAASVDAGSTISLAYDTTSNWGNPKWIEIDAVAAANGAGSYNWNTSSIPAGTYYLAGYMYDGGQAYYSHLTSAITITASTMPSFTLTSPTSGSFSAGQTVSIQWTAANVGSGSTISLAYDTTSNWGNPKWIEIDGVTAANGAGSYSWNTSSVPAGTYYMAGYMYDAGQAYYYHLGSAITITASVTPSFTLTSPTSGMFSAGQTVSIQWTAANVASGSTISLAYDTTSNWGNPKWIEIDAVTAANGAGSYSWNTSSVPAGTYYLAGYMYDASQPYYSHFTSAITITSSSAGPPSFTLTGPTSGTFSAGQTVSIQWTAANVASGSTISLAYDTTSNWGNPKWIEIDGVTAANGAGSYSWNTSSVPVGTYYLAGYMYDASQPYYYHLASAITITASVAPSFTLSAPASGTYTSGQTVSIQWTAANVPSGSIISLAYDTTSNWGNPTWIEINGVNAASGSGSYSWNTTGLAPGTYYIAGYLYTPSDIAYYSHLTTSFTVSG